MRPIVLLALVTLVLAGSPQSASACTLFTAANHPSGWGAAYNLFSSTAEPILRTACTMETFTPQIGSSQTDDTNFAVYSRGYYFDGDRWQELRFGPPSTEGSAWVIGDASAVTPVSYQGAQTFYAAYTCHRVAGAWRCGCQDTGCEQPAWQLQAVRVPAAAASPDTSEVTQAVVRLTNELRKERGLPEVVIRAELNQAAIAHTQDMASGGFLSHVGSDGSTAGERIRAAGYEWREYGENVARGYSTVAAVFSGWLASDGHRRNLLDPDVTETGVGFVAEGGYWTQIFAAPR